MLLGRLERPSARRYAEQEHSDSHRLDPPCNERAPVSAAAAAVFSFFLFFVSMCPWVNLCACVFPRGLVQEVHSYSGFVQEHEAVMEQYCELVRRCCWLLDFPWGYLCC